MVPSAEVSRDTALYYLRRYFSCQSFSSFALFCVASPVVPLPGGLYDSFQGGLSEIWQDDAVQRLSESHRGAIRALQSLAADMPNRKRSDGDTTYRELSAVMKQLSQLCTQLELAGAESARLSQVSAAHAQH